MEKQQYKDKLIETIRVNHAKCFESKMRLAKPGTNMKRLEKIVRKGNKICLAERTKEFDERWKKDPEDAKEFVKTFYCKRCMTEIERLIKSGNKFITFKMPTAKINYKKCTHCMTCVNICPQGIFYDDNGKVKVRQVQQCIECGACARQCPNNAITIS